MAGRTMKVERIRWILTVVLLCFVWNNAHWSVSLALSGLAVANELAARLRQSE